MRSNVRLGLLALVVIFNLGLVRAVYAAGGAEPSSSGPEVGVRCCPMSRRPRSRR